jgi:hypothetical protein
MDDLLTLIGRRQALFDDDVARAEGTLSRTVRESSFLVIGAAGSVGQAVTREIFRRDPKRLDLVDLSENNLVELIRDLRSSLGYTRGQFQALPLDCQLDRVPRLPRGAAGLRLHPQSLGAEARAEREGPVHPHAHDLGEHPERDRSV